MSKATQTDAMGSIQRGIKRTLDFVMSALGLILLSPIFIIISVLMKFQGNGPIFFRQIRIGYKGKPFVILKFRTISKKTEKNTPQLIAKTSWKSSTPFEKFLREHHLDELPQLFNVVKGDISLVGPRALVPHELSAYDKKHVLLAVKSGLTGLAVVSGRRSISFEERRRIDLYYVQNWSLWLDITILLKTCLVIFQKDN